jgi:hypothetical protein
LDHVVPAEDYAENYYVEVDQNDIENGDRMQDDQFDNLEIVAQKDMETRRASSVSNSHFFYKTEGLRMKDGG